MSSIKSAGAGLFAAAGFGSAFALAACCALPMALAAVGLGSSWLVPLVVATEPHTMVLRIVALVSIVASLALVALAARNCAPGELCARPGFRRSVQAMAVLSLILLVAGYIYA